MSVTNKLTGKGAYVSIGGVKIGMTKIDPGTTRKLADATDSTDYDAGTDLIWPTQLPVSAPVEVSIEGKYNLVTTPTNLIATLYTGAAAVAVVIGLSNTVVYGHGNMDISDFKASAPVDDMISFTANFRSNGIFVFGS